MNVVYNYLQSSTGILAFDRIIKSRWMRNYMAFTENPARKPKLIRETVKKALRDKHRKLVEQVLNG